jgi:hypothetical protein
MGTSRISVHAAVPPKRFIDALTDFGDNRQELWGNSEPSYLKVHDRGENWAEVTEGSGVAGGIWQRLRYDWSRPGVVRLDVVDSNAFGKGGFWEYQVTPDADGGSDIALTVHRRPITFKARLLDVLLIVAGGRVFGQDLRRTVAKLEQAGGDA